MVPNRTSRHTDQKSGRGALTDEALIKNALYRAAMSGKDDDMRDVILDLLEWPPCQKAVRAWFSGIEENLHGDTAMLLATVISRNAIGLAETDDLEAELREMYFIVAVHSPHPQVATALGNTKKRRRVSR